MGFFKRALFEFLDEAEDNNNCIVAWIKSDEVVVIIPSDDKNINLFLSRFVQTSSQDLASYPSLQLKARASYSDILEEEDTVDETDDIIEL